MGPAHHDEALISVQYIEYNNQKIHLVAIYFCICGIKLRVLEMLIV